MTCIYQTYARSKLSTGSRCEFGQTGWLARRRGSEERHWKSGPFAILGLRKLEPVRASMPLAAKAGRSKIKNSSLLKRKKLPGQRTPCEAASFVSRLSG